MRQREAGAYFYAYERHGEMIGFVCATVAAENKFTHDCFYEHRPDGGRELLRARDAMH